MHKSRQPVGTPIVSSNVKELFLCFLASPHAGAQTGGMGVSMSALVGGWADRFTSAWYLESYTLGVGGHSVNSGGCCSC
ncbi:hypothetical protein RRG08_013719 [Elysia crispata]|uniref:Uncharacterized protein n=1 Tax=Elysia crispata TaxID=231223 RepID=A0AAE0Z8M7_9GAST|nr:hypothetical protein RRG08_013719 [Elysia crispata]